MTNAISEIFSSEAETSGDPRILLNAIGKMHGAQTFALRFAMLSKQQNKDLKFFALAE